MPAEQRGQRPVEAVLVEVAGVPHQASPDGKVHHPAPVRGSAVTTRSRTTPADDQLAVGADPALAHR
jgi:hypothetical protein